MSRGEGFGEDDLLLAIRRIIGADAPEVLLGAGDDAALVEVGDHVVALTMDLLVEGVHFDPSRVAPRDLGYKAVVVNVSDVAAMGGSPRFGLVGLAVADRLDVPWVVELYGGMREAAIEQGMNLVGGDTTRADRTTLSVTVVGEVPRGSAVTRSGARPGDRIVVTGSLGASAGGLRLSIEPSHTIVPALGTAWARDLLAAHDRPTPRVGEGELLARSGATAMIDVSDGLALDLSRICRESDVGAVVDLPAVPVAPHLHQLREVLGTDPVDLALGGGEDYELLATLPAEAVEPAAATMREVFGTPLTDIGHVRAEPQMILVDANGQERPLQRVGWDPFRIDD